MALCLQASCPVVPVKSRFVCGHRVNAALSNSAWAGFPLSMARSPCLPPVESTRESRSEQQQPLILSDFQNNVG